MQIGCIAAPHLCPEINAPPMHFYSLDTTIGFGQHQGQTLREVLDINPNYLNFCVQALDHFAVRRADVEAWQQEMPELAIKMSAAAWASIDEKEAILDAREAEEDDHDDGDTYSARDAERDTFDALTDGQEGDYDDFFDRGGDMDSLRDGLGW